MPNNGRITLCPYYRDEKNLSISCEDVFRRFRWKSQKNKWLDTYCDKHWNRCPHAIELSRMYERMEDTMGEDNKRIVELEHEVAALRKELKKTASMLGRSEKREAAKEEEIKKLRKKNQYLEKKYIDYSGKLRQYEAHEQERVENMNGIVGMYEARFAYLMSEYSGGTFSEPEFRLWCVGKEFSIGYDEKKRLFTVTVREEKKKDE